MQNKKGMKTKWMKLINELKKDPDFPYNIVIQDNHEDRGSLIFSSRKTPPLPNPLTSEIVDKLIIENVSTRSRIADIEVQLDICLTTMNRICKDVDHHDFVLRKATEPEPQAGDYIVSDKVTPDNLSKVERVKNQKESEHPDYVCIKEFPTGKIPVGTILKKYKGHCDALDPNVDYYFFIDKDEIECLYSLELLKEDLLHFKIKETPLSDLNAEVQREHEEQEKYTKLANELVEMFMPLVNGWRKMDKATCATQAVCDNAYWFYNSGDQRKQAIRCAIKHSELNNYFDSPKVISQLQKMLSE